MRGNCDREKRGGQIKEKQAEPDNASPLTLVCSEIIQCSEMIVRNSDTEIPRHTEKYDIFNILNIASQRSC